MRKKYERVKQTYETSVFVVQELINQFDFKISVVADHATRIL